MSGDLETAAAALDGLEPDGGDDDADILLAAGKYAFFTSDFERRQAAAEEAAAAGARRRAQLEGARPRRAAGPAGPPRREAGSTACASSCGAPARTPRSPTPIFDGYLCAAEYLLYGPTPYAEVIERRPRPAGDRPAQRRAAGRGVRVGADRRGRAAVGRPRAGRPRADARPATSTATSARRPARRTRCSGWPRCAWPRATARRRCSCCSQALPLARGVDDRQAPPAAHLRHDDPRRARPARGPRHRRPGRVDARLGRRLPVLLDHAGGAGGDRLRPRRRPRPRRTAPGDRRAVRRCCGRARRGRRAMAEAQAVVAAASGDRATATQRMHSATEQFERAGQPLDAERCRQAMAAVTRAACRRARAAA